MSYTGTGKNENYYELLEVSENATEEVIQAAYRALAKRYHTDLHPDETDAEMAQLNAARDTLLDPVKRAEYNEELRAAKKKPAKPPVRYGQAEEDGDAVYDAYGRKKEPVRQSPKKEPSYEEFDGETSRPDEEEEGSPALRYVLLVIILIILFVFIGLFVKNCNAVKAKSLQHVSGGNVMVTDLLSE